MRESVQYSEKPLPWVAVCVSREGLSAKSNLNHLIYFYKSSYTVQLQVSNKQSRDFATGVTDMPGAGGGGGIHSSLLSSVEETIRFGQTDSIYYFFHVYSLL
jgi:hypothetical protein